MKVATLCYIRRDGYVLLQEKAEDRFGAGIINAPGGKVNPGEDVAEAAVREVYEETRLRIRKPRWHGILSFIFGSVEKHSLCVHIFTANAPEGRPRGTEGKLRWYRESAIPYGRMWPDDRYWLPIVLDGGEVYGSVYFSADTSQLLRCSLTLEWSP